MKLTYSSFPSKLLKVSGSELELYAKAPWQLREPQAWLRPPVLRQSGLHLRYSSTHFNRFLWRFPSSTKLFNCLPLPPPQQRSLCVSRTRPPPPRTFEDASASAARALSQKIWVGGGEYQENMGWDGMGHLVAENLAPSFLRLWSTSLSKYFCGR